eukprot:c25290_g2_i1 orf=158-1639(+)
MELMHKTLWALLVLAITCLLHLFLKSRRRSSPHLFPRGPPGSWPILGHLPFLRDGCPHHALAELSRTPGYGPIIGLRLGSTPAVVVCNADLAKELLLTQDKTFAHRPHFQLADSIFYGFNVGIAFSDYTPRWVKLRKMCTLELFTAKRLQALQQVRHEEVRGLLHTLLRASHQGTQAVNLGGCLLQMSINTISRILYSKKLAEVGGDSYSALLDEQERLVAPTLGDFIPWLKFLDVPQKRIMKNLHDRLDIIIESIFSERRQAMKNSTQAHELPQDFLQDVLSAGTHTTALTLEWAMAELLRNPRCLRKLCDEIDAVMGKGNEQLVSDEDVPKMPYLENTVKEVFRLHPVVPLLVPRMSKEEAKVDKYTLPAKTLVFVNAWALGRDPGVWEKAEEFMPERFEGKEMDVRGQDFELLPFGAGRRMCPGMRLALSIVHVTVANLVKAFDWELPQGQAHTDMDMSERRGITSCRNTPVLAIPIPRLQATNMSTHTP